MASCGSREAASVSTQRRCSCFWRGSQPADFRTAPAAADVCPWSVVCIAAALTVLPAGFLYCNMPELAFAQGERVRFHLLVLGTEGGCHSSGARKGRWACPVVT